MPKPARKKKNANLSNDDWEGAVISSGVFAISSANKPNPVEKRSDEAREHAHGP